MQTAIDINIHLFIISITFSDKSPCQTRKCHAFFSLTAGCRLYIIICICCISHRPKFIGHRILLLHVNIAVYHLKIEIYVSSCIGSHMVFIHSAGHTLFHDPTIIIIHLFQVIMLIFCFHSSCFHIFFLHSLCFHTSFLSLDPPDNPSVLSYHIP